MTTGPQSWLARPDLLVWAWVPAFAGAGIGVLIATIDRDSTAAAATFSATSEYTTWVAAVAGMVAAWALLALVCGRPFLAVRANLRTRRTIPVLALVLLGAVVFVAHMTIPLKEAPFFAPLPYYKARLAAFTLLGELAASLPVIGMWSLLVALGDIERRRALGPVEERVISAVAKHNADTTCDALIEGEERPVWSEVHAQVVRQLVEFHSHLRIFVVSGGVIIGATTLSTGALRNALYSWLPQSAGSLDHVLLYGTMMTILLALIYIPVDLALHQAAEDLLNDILPLPTSRLPDPTWVANRARLEEMLYLKRRPLDSFRSVLAVFAPFIGSLISILMRP